jgi:hypothetical protein
MMFLLRLICDCKLSYNLFLFLFQVESNRKYNALTSTLRRHDVALLAERKRRNLIKVSELTTTPNFWN